MAVYTMIEDRFFTFKDFDTREIFATGTYDDEGIVTVNVLSDNPQQSEAELVNTIQRFYDRKVGNIYGEEDEVKRFWLGANGIEYLSFENTYSIFVFDPDFDWEKPKHIINSKERIMTLEDFTKTLKEGEAYELSYKLIDNPSPISSIDKFKDEEEEKYIKSLGGFIID